MSRFISALSAHINRTSPQPQYAPPPGPPPGHYPPNFLQPQYAPPGVPQGYYPSNPLPPPPQWRPAPEQSHVYGLLNEAPEDEYATAIEFCRRYPPFPPQLLPSHIIEQIDEKGCQAWTLEYPRTPRFVGHIRDPGEKGIPAVVKLITGKACKDTSVLSQLPLSAGMYEIRGKTGVYYELLINKMDGVIAIGTACRPHPDWRLPGWDRLSAGLHLDDFRKFFEDPLGGRDYTPELSRISPGDTIGCGYHFATGSLFFTHNGMRLPDAFTGIYMPRAQHDVYAAIGVEGENEVDVNFGGELFRWKEGNEWAWRVEGHGRLGDGYGTDQDAPPAYGDIGTSSSRRH